MILTVIELDLEFFYVNSLKDRRKILNSIKDRLKNKNLSILDLSGDYAKEGSLAIAYLSINEVEKNKKKDKIIEILDSFYGEIEYKISIEEI